jgi:LysM repeat protein
MSTLDRIGLPSRGRHAAPRGRGSFARSLLGAVPVVIVGSLALALGANPADADRKTDRDNPDSGSTDRLDFASDALSDGSAVAGRTSGASTTGDQPSATGSAAAVTAPASAMAPFEYTVVEGDTISDISARYGLSTASVLALNGLSWKTMIFPGQVLSLNASATPAMPVDMPLSRYTVSDGDTISGIAAQHGIATAAVLSANGLGRDSIIYPGQSIVLPQLGESLDATPVVSTAPLASDEELDEVAYEDSYDADYTGTVSDYSGPLAPVTHINGSVVELTDEMRANATQIVSIGRELGVPNTGIVIALAAAMQESTFRNLSWGHLDSVGLFQQRPSTGWGLKNQILDTDYAIRTFYTGIHTEDVTVNGLLDIEGWQEMSLTEAAQAVQLSAYPDAYGAWEADAWAWLSTL